MLDRHVAFDPSRLRAFGLGKGPHDDQTLVGFFVAGCHYQTVFLRALGPKP